MLDVGWWIVEKKVERRWARTVLSTGGLQDYLEGPGRTWKRQRWLEGRRRCSEKERWLDRRREGLMDGRTEGLTEGERA